MLTGRERLSVRVIVFLWTHRLSHCLIAQSCCLAALATLVATGCDRDRNVPPDEIVHAEEAANQRPLELEEAPPPKVESVEYYETKLLDKTFVWDGPTSCEDRIPVLHAARALAYIGDPAVPALLRASTNKVIHFPSVYDALAEIGLPVYEYWKDGQRDPKPLEKWWERNRVKTALSRSQHRERIGLPPIAGTQDECSQDVAIPKPNH
jgi:hypothetical protein